MSNAPSRLFLWFKYVGLIYFHLKILMVSNVITILYNEKLLKRALQQFPELAMGWAGKSNFTAGELENFNSKCTCSLHTYLTENQCAGRHQEYACLYKADLHTIIIILVGFFPQICLPLQVPTLPPASIIHFINQLNYGLFQLSSELDLRSLAPFHPAIFLPIRVDLSISKPPDRPRYQNPECIRPEKPPFLDSFPKCLKQIPALSGMFVLVCVCVRTSPRAVIVN